MGFHVGACRRRAAQVVRLRPCWRAWHRALMHAVRAAIMALWGMPPQPCMRTHLLWRATWHSLH